jgi:hypothetical protein
MLEWTIFNNKQGANRMAKILAIDPGNEYSAYVEYNTETCKLVRFGKIENDDLANMLSSNEFFGCSHLAIEMVACYGMPVGKTIFDTCVWIGRFIECWTEGSNNKKHIRVYRKETKMHLCQTMRAKDSNIRQAIIDRYPATGGGKKPQIGTKAQPGPLYGVSKDVWAALAVAITFAETFNELNKP